LYITAFWNIAVISYKQPNVSEGHTAAMIRAILVVVIYGLTSITYGFTNYIRVWRCWYWWDYYLTCECKWLSGSLER
jgi:hypothetical protein